MPDNARSQSVEETPANRLIRQQLNRILASAAFSQAERLGRFLRFAVEQALDDRRDLLKESILGVEVFDRSPDYDPKVDPIVRVQARRLREKLQQYYASEGADDPVLIEVPKGAYVPRFERRPGKPASLHVLPGPASPLPGSGSTATLAVTARRPSRVLRRLTVSLVVTGIVASGWLAFSLIHRDAPALTITPVTTYIGAEFHPGVSPDGQYLAFVWQGEHQNYDVYVKQINSGTPLRVTSDVGHDLHPAWSPDGRQLIFLRMSPGRKTKEVLIVPAFGGPERRVAEIRSGAASWLTEASAISRMPGPAWSPDGRHIAIGKQQGDEEPDRICLVNLETGEERAVTTPPRTAHLGDSWPAFSPKGDRVAFARFLSQGVGDVYVQPLDGGTAKQLTFDRREIGGLTWSADARSIIYAVNRDGAPRLWRVPASGGTPEPIYAAGRNVSQPSVSRDGSRLVYRESFQNINIRRFDLENGGRPGELIGTSRQNYSPQYSPDGKRIVFMSDRSGNDEIWRCNSDGSNPMQLTSLSTVMTGTPRWSPDGRHIAFDSRLDGHPAIYVISAEGGQPRRLTPAGSDDMMPAWSHDGRWIYYNSNSTGTGQVWRIPSAGGAPVQITKGGAHEALESPDGKFLYYLKPSPRGLWRVPVTGGEEVPVPELSGAVQPSRCWTITERGIYFVPYGMTESKIALFQFATRKIHWLITLEGRVPDSTPSLTVSPDHRWATYAEFARQGSDISMLDGFR